MFTLLTKQRPHSKVQFIKHYVNLVKALKWWRRIDDPEGKQPKSSPLEHLIGQSFPEAIDSVAEGIMLTLEKLLLIIKRSRKCQIMGFLNMMFSIDYQEQEYEAFYERVKEAANMGREALDAETVFESATAWRK
ncbi:hypothetical protein ACIQYG_18485 [Peribacillus sp. NPDC096622]|uniref:hypothetical protein n=1 Tax=Peribacillus sp. NPDC096622 TaxID=3364396 RepID=UPI00381E558E